MSDPQIPFGFKRVHGPLQKGDGIYVPATGKFAKVKKQYPNTEYVEVFAIRKCAVEQTELPEITPGFMAGVANCMKPSAAGVPAMDLDE